MIYGQQDPAFDRNDKNNTKSLLVFFFGLLLFILTLCVKVITGTYIAYIGMSIVPTENVIALDNLDFILFSKAITVETFMQPTNMWSHAL